MIGLYIWGERACFTDPAFKVERSSYEVPTVSAIKGVLRAIYWKPEFEWVVRKIHVLNPIKFDSLVQKELKKSGQVTGDPDHFTLRNTRHLVSPKYYVEVEAVQNPFRLNARHAGPYAYENEATSRMRKGQQFKRPFLGMSNFPASWELAEIPPVSAIPLTKDLGTMLFDMVPVDLAKDHFKPLFFRASIENGVITIPRDMTASYLDTMFKVRNKAHKNKENTQDVD